MPKERAALPEAIPHETPEREPADDPIGEAMPSRVSEALVHTPNASRYLKQLANHFRHEAQRQPGLVTVEFDDNTVEADFGMMGTCHMRAEPNGLRIELTARDPDSLRSAQRVVSTHLESFGRREGLTIDWTLTSEAAD
jgi:hypothetical protein